MCRIVDPLTRYGRVLSFENLFGNNELHFTREESHSLAQLLSNSAGDSLPIRIASLIRDMVSNNSLSQNTEVVEQSTDSQVFSNNLVVVKFGDTVVNSDGRIIRIGCSATVCEGTRKSKVWVRVSSPSLAGEVNEAAPHMEFMRLLAARVSDELETVYLDGLNSFVKSQGREDKFQSKTAHVFLMEAGDYPSDKLFDSITTLRETFNLFTLVDEDDWSPVNHLIEFAANRMSKSSNISSLPTKRHPSDSEIERISNYFNEEGRMLNWEVTLGRHGLFAVDEVTIDDKNDCPRTHIVGLCHAHSQVNPVELVPDNRPRPSSWFVSGSLAPRLGAAF